MATFVDPAAAKEFECGVCLDIFTEPVQIGCNEGHVFCKKCVIGLVTRHKTTIKCPMCRAKCKTSKSFQKIHFIERQIKNLKVKCINHQITKEKASYFQLKSKPKHPNNNNSNHNTKTVRRSARIRENNNKDAKVSGHKRKRKEINDNEGIKDNNDNKRKKLNDEELCDWIGTLSEFKVHKEKCVLQLISCQYCKKKMLRKEYRDHHKECLQIPIQCKQCKTKNISRNKMKKHIQYFCTETIIDCDLCRKSVKRKKYMDHKEKECLEAVVKCTFNRFGCDVTFMRKNMAQHNTTFCHSHLVKVTNSHLQMEKRMDKLEHTVERLSAGVDEVDVDNREILSLVSEDDDVYASSSYSSSSSSSSSDSSSSSSSSDSSQSN